MRKGGLYPDRARLWIAGLDYPGSLSWVPGVLAGEGKMCARNRDSAAREFIHRGN